MPNIEINGKTYTVELAITEEEKEKGLQGVDNLPNDSGMLFVYSEPQTVGFWMEDTLIPLDIIFINEDYQVVAVDKGEPESKDIFQHDNVCYVLELNQDSGVSVGDEVDLSEVEATDLEDSDEQEEPDSIKMLVIGEKGKPQMELEGGERIFSRPHTRMIVYLSKKAYKSKSDSDYKKLGKKVFQYIDKQDTQDQQYVEMKK